MGFIRLYRKFYCVSTAGASDSYTLITPTSLSASTYVAGTNGNESSTLIESALTIIEEETGVFYTDLNPKLYAADVSYDLVFYVQYTSAAPSNKKLSRRFRIRAVTIAGVLDYDLGDTTNIVVEILNTNNDVIDVDVMGDGINIDLSSQEVEHYINNDNGSGPIDFEIN